MHRRSPRAAFLALALLAIAAMDASTAADSPAPISPADEPLPAFGEYVFVEDLPEVVTKVQPVYPEAARAAGVSGKVLVQVLVGRDGTVRETRVVKSIPPLDSAAVAAVRQWRFRPAVANGQPVAVWVAAPISFRLEGGFGPADSLPSPPRIDPERLRELPVQELRDRTRFSGAYFVDPDRGDSVIATAGRGTRVRLESPRQWKGSGTFERGVYRGTFEYRRDAPDPRHRGARGTHVARIQADGRLEVEGRFANRDWPPFRVTWMPLDAGLRFRGDRALPPGEPRAGRVPGRVEHPVWPPEGRGAPEAPFEHPVWPPEWFRGDFSVVPAVEDEGLDSLPRLAHRVEPDPPDHSGRHAGVEGIVVVRALVRDDGTVGEAAPVRSIPMLDAAAIAAVKQWRFRPALSAGRPVPADVYVPVRFVLR